MPDVKKLPQWAQQRIENAERRIAELERQLTHDEEDSNTFANPYLSMDRDVHGIPPGRDETIRFFLDVAGGEEVNWREYFDAELLGNDGGGQYLRIYGSDSVLVRPRASNVVEFVLRRR